VLTVVALVAGTVAAIAVTQSFRNEGTVISAVSWRWAGPPPERPGRCPGHKRSRQIPVSFFLNRDDTVSAAVVDLADAEPRRTLLVDRRLEGDRRHCFLWDGLDDLGRPVPPGAYRLQVSLADADRVAVAGERIRISARSQTSRSPGGPG
jgi:hypothetical protein